MNDVAFGRVIAHFAHAEVKLELVERVPAIRLDE
jgi:hypothetical protein